MGIVNPKDGTLKISRLVILDVAIISLLTWLIVRDIAPLYLTTLIAYPVLFIANFVVIWKVYRTHRPPQRSTRLSTLMWFPAILFTASGSVVIVNWIRNPDVWSTLQAVAAPVLAGWMWFLVAYHRRAKREN